MPLSPSAEEVKPVRVLLIWPGTDGVAAGNFGVPQLVTIAGYVREKTGALVDIIDLYSERAFGPVDLTRIFSGPHGTGYDIVGFSCYSSFDFLKVEAIASIARTQLPNAVFVAGGYHVSARPAELLAAGFDVAVVGEGERPMVTIVESVKGGSPLRETILGPEPIERLDDLPPSDWSYLERYRPVLSRVAPQVQLYLSRGCPFDCAFCMERAKREVSWRAYSVERAVDEVRRLSAFIDLENTTVYVADALFGMRKQWRREFLDRLAAEKLLARKLWLLIRVDMIDDEDLRQFTAANCALGFGLESGDPVHLATIRKAGRLDTYLDQMRFIAARSRELDLPWGANVIVGHPGETESSLRRSAAYLSELFLDPKGTTGFLSVDPFRLYPGSPIDDEREAWEARFGCRFHRTSWWQDGDQEFLSEWVDPSSDLDYRRRAALSHELMAPILGGLGKNFVYKGVARDYFEAAIREQVGNLSPRYRLHFIGRYYAWNKYTGRSARAAEDLSRDTETAELLRERREDTLDRVAKLLHPSDAEAASAFLGSTLGHALLEIPRERFVPSDLVLETVRDEAIPLDGTGLATVSAFHAYARSFRLAGVEEGSRVLDLGGGTGYGASILGRLVGERGSVVSIEVDPRLVAIATSLLDKLGASNVEMLSGDATAPETLENACKAAGPFDAIVWGFAMEAIPASWGGALRAGGFVVGPVGSAESQQLVRARWNGESFEPHEEYETVLYVRARKPEEIAAPPASRAASERRSLPLHRSTT
ncbi:MAG: radical SAM protein [Polyangiaceae bacterium]|nr:radical SAM protein [Polyangiaceae bacterium]